MMKPVPFLLAGIFSMAVVSAAIAQNNPLSLTASAGLQSNVVGVEAELLKGAFTLDADADKGWSGSSHGELRITRAFGKNLLAAGGIAAEKETGEAAVEKSAFTGLGYLF